MKMLIALSLVLSAPAWSCQQPKCRSVEVCSNNSKRPVCHRTTVCEGGTCGSMKMLLQSQRVLPTEITEELLNQGVNDLSFELRAYVSEGGQQIIRLALQDGVVLENQKQFHQYLRTSNFPSVFISAGSSYTLFQGTISCDRENEVCLVK